MRLDGVTGMEPPPTDERGHHRAARCATAERQDALPSSADAPLPSAGMGCRRDARAAGDGCVLAWVVETWNM
jgi:hypothetical protein